MNIPSTISRDELAEFVYTGSGSELQGLDSDEAVDEIYREQLDAIYWLGAPDVEEELERYSVAESAVLHNPTEVDMVLYGPEDKWSIIRDRLNSTASDLRVNERSYPVGKDDSFVDNMNAIDDTVTEESRIAIVGSDYCMSRIQRLADSYVDSDETYVLGAQTDRKGVNVDISEKAKTFLQERSFEPWKTFR